jgi:hypothetical protein
MMIFPDPPCEIAEANVTGHVDYWDFDVSDTDEVIVLRHRGVRYVAGIDSALHVFIGESFGLDEVGEKDYSLGPVEGHRLAADVHDEGDHAGEVGLASEAS